MAVVGSAQVVIRAITDRLEADIQRGLQNSLTGMDRVGDDIGERLGSRISGSLDVDTSGAENSIRDGADRAGSDAGDRIGGGLRDGMRDGARRGSDDIVREARGAGGRSGNIFNRAFTGGGNRANRVFISMALRIAALVPVIALLVGGISSLVSGLFAIASAAAPAVFALSSFANVLTAVIQGAGVAIIAFGGVGQALSAGMKASAANVAQASADTSGAAEQAARAVRNAMENIEDAERNAARAIIDAQRAVRDAKENLADVYFQTARAERDAIESVSDAEEALSDSHERVRDAQEALTQARKDARDQLIELQFAERGGAIAEQRAIMALQDARFQLNATSELPSDNRVRQQAILDYKEAQLNLDEIRKKNNDNAKDLKKAQKDGVSGNEAVKDAQEELSDAQEGVSDAARDYNDAIVDQTRLQDENTRAIRDAREAYAAAQQALEDAYREGPRAIRDAKEALEEAQRAQADVNKEMAGGGRAADAYAKALANLSPPARKFVEYLMSVRDEFRSLKTAAQAGLFPQLQTAIELLVNGPLFPKLQSMFRSTGDAVGRAAVSISKSLNSGPFVESFGNVTNQNVFIIRSLGRSFGNLTRALFAMMDAARPITAMLVQWFEKWSQNLRINTEAKNSTGELTATFNNAAMVARQLFRIIGNLGEGIADMARIAAPSGRTLLDQFEAATQAFADFTDVRENRVMLRQFFDDVAKNFTAISSLILVASGALARLGADPEIGQLAAALEPTILKLEQLFKTMLDNSGAALVETLNSLIDAFAALSDNNAIAVFLGTINAALKVFTFLLGAPVIGDGLGLLLKVGAALYAIKIITKFPGISLLINTIGKSTAFKFLVAYLKSTATWLLRVAANSLRTAAAFVWQKAVIAATKAWAAAQWLLNAAMSANPIGLAIAAIVAIGVALFAAYKRFEGFRKVVNAVFKAVVDAAEWLWDVLFGHSIFPDLIDGFKWFFSVTAKIFDKIGDVISGLIDVVRAVFNFVSKHWRLLAAILFGPIGIAVGLVTKHFDKIKSVITTVISFVINFVKNNWQTILAVLTGPIGLAVLLIVKNWDRIKSIFTGAVDWITNAFKVAWSVVTSVVMAPINGATRLIRNAWTGYKLLFRAGREWVGTVFRVAWSKVRAILVAPINAARSGISAAFNFIRRIFTSVKNWITTQFSNAWLAVKVILLNPINNARVAISNLFGAGGPIRRIFTAIKDWVTGTFSRSWSRVRSIFMSPVNAVRSAIDRIFGEDGPVRSAFRSVVTAITNIWDGIRSAVARPVRFVVETVYNNGIRKALNYIPGVNLKEAELGALKNYATGGVLPGYTPGRDVHTFVSRTGGRLALSGGEAVMRPEFTRAVGGVRGVNALNKLAIQKKLDFNTPGYFMGGVLPLPGATRIVQHMTGYPGMPYAGDFNKGAGYDDFGAPIVAWKSGIVTPFDLGSDRSYGRGVTMSHGDNRSTLYAHMSRIAANVAGRLVPAGKTIGYVGDYGNTGSPPTSHLHFEIRGGAIKNLGGGSGTSADYAGILEKSRSAKIKDWFSTIFKVKKTFETIKSSIGKMSGNSNEWFNKMRATAKYAAREAVQAANDKIPNKIKLKGPVPDINLPNNPIPNPFDRGGVASGVGYMRKETLRPERVLSPRQTDNFERLVNALEKINSSSSNRQAAADAGIKLDVHVPHSASAAEVVEGIVYELRRGIGRGKYGQ